MPAQRAEAIVLCDVMAVDAGDVAVTLGVHVDHLRRRLRAGRERLARPMALKTSR